jgi:hypothetical protein
MTAEERGVATDQSWPTATLREFSLSLAFFEFCISFAAMKFSN